MSDDTETQISNPRALEPKFLTQSRFDEMDLPAKVLSGLEEAGFTYATPIQAQVLPVSLTGKDVAGQAQTGTGKTAAFLLTIFSRLLAHPKKDSTLASALIVAPTRELAAQIYEEACLLGRHTGLKFAQIVGGVDYKKQADILTKGTDIVICTPGRIIDYFKQGVFKTKGIEIVVIDEADRLLDLGFAKDMRFILQKLPHYEKRQSMLFSATLSHSVLELTYEYMNLPEFIAVTPEEVTVEGIEQSLFHVGKDEKLPLLLGLLEREDWGRGLIFVNTRVGVQWLAQKLKGNRIPAEGITGELPQVKRFRLMKRFKEGGIKILVATDVASRGIHVEDITHVFNYDLPQDAENYIHRIGRTARAGKTGRAISFACEKYVFHLGPIEEMIGQPIPPVWPEDDWFKRDESGPVSVGRKGPGPQPPRGRGRKMQRKPPPPVRAGRATGEKPRPVPSKQPSAPDRPPRPARQKQRPDSSKSPSAPGTFFGFGPASEKGKTQEAAKKPNTSGKRRRRRPRSGKPPEKKADAKT
ncbi:MAG: DEAD/DEAH box helicase [Desulfobacterales bacterium]